MKYFCRRTAGIALPLWLVLLMTTLGSALVRHDDDARLHRKDPFSPGVVDILSTENDALEEEDEKSLLIKHETRYVDSVDESLAMTSTFVGAQPRRRLGMKMKKKKKEEKKKKSSFSGASSPSMISTKTKKISRKRYKRKSQKRLRPPRPRPIPPPMAMDPNSLVYASRNLRLRLPSKRNQFVLEAFAGSPTQTFTYGRPRARRASFDAVLVGSSTTRWYVFEEPSGATTGRRRRLQGSCPQAGWTEVETIILNQNTIGAFQVTGDSGNYQFVACRGGSIAFTYSVIFTGVAGSTEEGTTSVATWSCVPGAVATCTLADSLPIFLLPVVTSTRPPTGPPTFFPTRAPVTALPTTSPSVSVTGFPSLTPSKQPTSQPTTASPSTMPSVFPTRTPSSTPTTVPTAVPSVFPTAKPSQAPSVTPTAHPTTASPTEIPTVSPTGMPSVPPTSRPTRMPTTASPTGRPTSVPTKVPTVVTAAPSTMEPVAESEFPSEIPSELPSEIPSGVPSESSF